MVLLSPAAEALEGKYPLAAVLMRRALVDHTLSQAKSTRYKHAVRHIHEMESLDTFIDDYGEFETHDAFLQRINSENPRKVRFWAQMLG